MEKIKVYFCKDSECVKDFLPCSFTFKDVVEHFGYSCRGKKIAACGYIVKEDEIISNPDYIDCCEGEPFIDIVLFKKYYE